jgi:hypothetical protein
MSDTQSMDHAKFISGTAQIWYRYKRRGTSSLFDKFHVFDTREVRFNLDGKVVVPINDDSGVPVNLLMITEDRVAETIKGHPISKIRFEMGTPKNGKPIFITDDFLEAVTLNEATRVPVYVVFYGRNIETMIDEVRKDNPDSMIYVAYFKSIIRPMKKTNLENLDNIKKKKQDGILFLDFFNSETGEQTSLYDLFREEGFEILTNKLQLSFLDAVEEKEDNKSKDSIYAVAGIPKNHNEIRRKYLSGFIPSYKRFRDVYKKYDDAKENIDTLEKKLKEQVETIKMKAKEEKDSLENNLNEQIATIEKKSKEEKDSLENKLKEQIATIEKKSQEEKDSLEKEVSTLKIKIVELEAAASNKGKTQGEINKEKRVKRNEGWLNIYKENIKLLNIRQISEKIAADIEKIVEKNIANEVSEKVEKGFKTDDAQKIVRDAFKKETISSETIRRTINILLEKKK